MRRSSLPLGLIIALCLLVGSIIPLAVPVPAWLLDRTYDCYLALTNFLNIKRLENIPPVNRWIIAENSCIAEVAVCVPETPTYLWHIARERFGHVDPHLAVWAIKRLNTVPDNQDLWPAGKTLLLPDLTEEDERAWRALSRRSS